MRFKKFLPLMALIFILTIGGSFGFMALEGWNFFDSFYMTVITLSTVGYGEVHPLTMNGKIFSIFLIMSGVGLVTYSVSTLIAEISSIDFEQRRMRVMKNTIEKLRNHTIICGFGRMGEVICRELEKSGVQFVVIEKREELIHEIKRCGYLYIEGDAAHDDNLIASGIDQAKVLVSVIDNDSDGLYVALAGRSLNKDLFIIIRANESKARKRILRAGADKVILPFVMSGQKVAETVINPAVESLFDLTGGEENEDQKLQLADLFVTEQSIIKGRSIGEIGDSIHELIIVGVRNGQNEFIYRPHSSYIFRQGDCIITLGPRLAYQDALKNYKLTEHTPNRFATLDSRFSKENFD